MYDPKSVELRYANGTRGALSNICHGNGVCKAYASVMDLHDAVEDSTDLASLLRNLKSLRLVGMDHLCIDRDTASYTRLRGDDPLGNIHYLIVKKAE